MRVYFKTIVAVACIVTASYFLTLHAKDLNIPEDSVGIFLELFGLVYAIIIGFAIFEVLNNYNQIKHSMNAEVNELQDLRDYLMYVDGQEETKSEIVSYIKQYVQAVIQREWPNMCSYKGLDIDTPPEIYQVMQSVNKIKPANDSDVLALEKLVNTIGTLTTCRTNRITASVEKLPALLTQLIFILSMFMIGTFALLPMEPISIKMLLIAINSFGIIFIYFVIKDLDYPFGGVWSIQPKPFEQFLTKFDQ